MLLTTGKSFAIRKVAPLECFELSALRYVSIEGQTAFVRSPDGRVRRMRRGDYMGWNDGIISKVEDSVIILIELRPDGEGGWMEAEARLPRSALDALGPADALDRCRPGAPGRVESSEDATASHDG